MASATMRWSPRVTVVVFFTTRVVVLLILPRRSTLVLSCPLAWVSVVRRRWVSTWCRSASSCSLPAREPDLTDILSASSPCRVPDRKRRPPWPPLRWNLYMLSLVLRSLKQITNTPSQHYWQRRGRRETERFGTEGSAAQSGAHVRAAAATLKTCLRLRPTLPPPPPAAVATASTHYLITIYSIQYNHHHTLNQHMPGGEHSVKLPTITIPLFLMAVITQNHI